MDYDKDSIAKVTFLTAKAPNELNMLSMALIAIISCLIGFSTLCFKIESHLVMVQKILGLE